MCLFVCVCVCVCLLYNCVSAIVKISSCLCCEHVFVRLLCLFACMCNSVQRGKFPSHYLPLSLSLSLCVCVFVSVIVLVCVVQVSIFSVCFCVSVFVCGLDCMCLNLCVFLCKFSNNVYVCLCFFA